MKKTDIIIKGAGGQNVPHRGYILLHIDAIGEKIRNVPALVVPVTKFIRSTPLLLGTNVILAVRGMLHSKYGRGFMTRAHKSANWYSAFQCINTDGIDIARTNGEIGHLRYAGRRSLEVQPGAEVIITANAPKYTKGRCITALVEGKSNSSLAVGQMLVEVRDCRVPIRLCNLSHQTVTVRRNAVVAWLSSIQVVHSTPDPDTADVVTFQQTASDENPMPDIDVADLTPSERIALEDVLRQNADVFSKDSLDIGMTTTVDHEIPLTDPTPFRIPYRRIVPGEFQEVRKHIEELERTKVIKPSQSPFASPVERWQY